MIQLYQPRICLDTKKRPMDPLFPLVTVVFHYGSLILLCPILALIYRCKGYSWSLIRHALTNPIVIAACQVTVMLAVLATMINFVFGLMIAWVLTKFRFPGKKLLDIAVDLPFALPTSVGGLTLMTVYSDQGWMAPLCNLLGIKIAFSRLGVLIAMIFVSLPFIIRTLQPVLSSLDYEMEEAAWCLGASPWTTFWWVIFPSLTSSLLTGTALAFSRAIGEYGSIVLVSSNRPRRDLVISVLIFQRLEQYDYQGATSIAMLVLIMCFLLLLTINSMQIWKRSLKK